MILNETNSGLVGKGSFVAPVSKCSEDLTTEDHVYGTDFVSVHPICSDKANKINKVSKLISQISLIAT